MLQARTNDRSAVAQARGARTFTLVIFALVTVGLGLASYLTSQAASAGASSFNIGPSPLTVGSVVTYSFTIRNLSDDSQATQTIELTTIQGYPACNVIDHGSAGNAPCNVAVDQNAGVFAPAPTGTGAAGTACGGTTFNVIEAASGLWTFVPTGAGAPVILQPASLGASNPLTTCIIVGSVTVDAPPATDANLALAGVQTRQLSYAQGFTSLTADEFTGTGATSVTFAAPDIKVEKSGNGTVKAGANAVFGIVVTNLGPGVATNVTLTDPLPSTAGTWAVGGPNAASCTVVGDLLTCAFGALAEGATRTITVTSPTVARDCGTLPNTVTVSATNEGANKANNSASATVTVTCLPDIKVTKVGNGSVKAGANAVFTIVVTNLGPGTATAVSLNDPLPSTAGTWTVGGPNAASCNIVGDLLTCAFGDLAEGATRTITVTSPTASGGCAPTSLATTRTTTADWGGGRGDEGSCGSDGDCRTPTAGMKTTTARSGGGRDDDGWCDPGGDCRTPTTTGTKTTTARWGGGHDDEGSCGWPRPEPPRGDSDCGRLHNTVTVAATNEGPNLANNTASAKITIECKQHGRMTGGGSVSAPGDVTHGFELHCDPQEKPNNLEINWGKGVRKYRFHLEELLTAVCTDTGIRQAPPAAPFDTLVGKGVGRFGEAPGAAVRGYSIEFTLTDGGPSRGEPGIDDTATFKIYETANPSNVVLTTTGKVTRGNHQAHK